MSTRVLAIMGSGETAPTMVKIHRELLGRAGTGPAVLLDTPYGFQTNALDISRRAQDYFAASVGHQVEVVSWRRAPTDVLERERALAALREASWIFCGPGSPTYALRQWRDTPLPAVLAERLAAGAMLVFASAAAVTLGEFGVPVYEIYKAGEDPRWEPGLDLVHPATGLPAVVIPHFDNAEGGHYDTRYCYLGEQRLSAMERDLPDGMFVLGVDEHTALVLDLDAASATVMGNGTVTVRRQGRATAFGAGTTLTFADLADVADRAAASAGATHPILAVVTDDGRVPDPVHSQPSLKGTATGSDREFREALAGRSVDGCVAAMLELEQALQDWVADTDISDDRDHARGLLRSMAVELGELARAGAGDPRDRVAPYVEALLEIRAEARTRGDYASADAIRTRLLGAGLELHDTPTGTDWNLTC